MKPMRSNRTLYINVGCRPIYRSDILEHVVHDLNNKCSQAIVGGYDRRQRIGARRRDLELSTIVLSEEIMKLPN